jgi:HEAT repeat protein
MNHSPIAAPHDDRLRRDKERLVQRWFCELRDPHVSLRWSAALALGRLTSIAAAAIPRLIEALSDPDVKVRRLAVMILGAAGPISGPPVSALLEALDDADECVRHRAAVALGYAGVPVALPTQRRAVDPNVPVPAQLLRPSDRSRGQNARAA